VVTEIPKCGNVKTGQREVRREVRLLSKIWKTVSNLYLREEFYVRQITTAVFDCIEMKTQEM